MKRCYACGKRIWFWQAAYWSWLVHAWFHGECGCIWLDMSARELREEVRVMIVGQRPSQQTAALLRKVSP